MPRNPLEIIRHYIGFFEETLKQKERVNPDNKMILECKIDLLKTLESDFEIEYFPLGDKTTLGQLRPGAVFATEDGVYAVKTQYHHDIIDMHEDESGVNLRCQCVLLGNGQYGVFNDGNKTVVYEVVQPRQRKDEE